MRAASILLALACLATPALASEEPKESKSAGQYIDVSPVALPVIVKGRLINYVFVTVRLNLAGGADPVALRIKEPYLRDALVRVAYRTPFTDPKSYTRLNEAAIKAAMAREAVRIIGPRAVTTVEITNSTPQKLSGLPKPAA